jgi:ubiquinone/menaquinone biosynthesis C-methylase UbiE
MSTVEYSNILDKTNLDTYEIISTEFAETRAYVWKCVKEFTSIINYKSNVLEIGCGNGKNMTYILNNVDCNMVGVDTCQKFVDMCQDLKLKVYTNTILDLKFNDSSFDFVLCIAMFHHLLTLEDQGNAMKEILRVMKTDAFCKITCWSTEQPDNSKFTFHEGINVVMWKGRQDLNKTRYYYVFSEKMFRDFFDKYTNIKIFKIYNEVGNWIILFQKI